MSDEKRENDNFDRRTKAYLKWREDAGQVWHTLPSSTVFFAAYDARNEEVRALHDDERRAVQRGNRLAGQVQDLESQLAEARATIERVRLELHNIVVAHRLKAYSSSRGMKCVAMVLDKWLHGAT